MASSRGSNSDIDPDGLIQEPVGQSNGPQSEIVRFVSEGADLSPGVGPFFARVRKGCRAASSPARRWVAELARGDEAIAPCSALSTQASPAFGLARLFVEFADAHFFLDAAPLDELAEAANRLLGRLFVS